MSIIYEALKKLEGKKVILSSENVSKNMTFPIGREGKKFGNIRRVYFFIAVLLLVVLGLLTSFFIFSHQEQTVQGGEVKTSVVDKIEIDTAKIYLTPEPKSQVPEKVILEEEPVQEYILEGIVFDSKVPFALINGKVIKESDNLDNFRIDKISKSKVEMTNTQDNNKVTLFFSD